jgi:hypothetical protein
MQYRSGQVEDRAQRRARLRCQVGRDPVQQDRVNDTGPRATGREIGAERGQDTPDGLGHARPAILPDQRPGVLGP